MLVLSRKAGEQIVLEIDGEEVVVEVKSIGDYRVGLGILAPAHIRVMRQELMERSDDE